MTEFTALIAAAAAFVGTHFALSHPLRRRLVGALGQALFLGLYSFVAAVAFGATILAYRAAPVTAPLWEVGDGFWMTATLLMLIASVLFVGSLFGNPALAGMPGGAAASASARGVYAVTRHPMMWAFALWGLCHILVYPVTKNIVLSVAIIVLALVGSALQDAKKRGLDPHGWAGWQSRTSYTPFAAIIGGRAQFGGFGMSELAGGVVLWLLATWAHIPLTGWAAGVWRWIV